MALAKMLQLPGHFNTPVSCLRPALKAQTSSVAEPEDLQRSQVGSRCYWNSDRGCDFLPLQEPQSLWFLWNRIR